MRGKTARTVQVLRRWSLHASRVTFAQIGDVRERRRLRGKDAVGVLDVYRRAPRAVGASQRRVDLALEEPGGRELGLQLTEDAVGFVAEAAGVLRDQPLDLRCWVGLTGQA